MFWIDLPDQWDPKSPWHDFRVRRAALHAIDRNAINKAETLGFSQLTGSIIPRSFEFALAFEPPAYEPGAAPGPAWWARPGARNGRRAQGGARDEYAVR